MNTGESQEIAQSNDFYEQLGLATPSYNAMPTFKMDGKEEEQANSPPSYHIPLLGLWI